MTCPMNVKNRKPFYQNLLPPSGGFCFPGYADLFPAYVAFLLLSRIYVHMTKVEHEMHVRSMLSKSYLIIVLSVVNLYQICSDYDNTTSHHRLLILIFDVIVSIIILIAVMKIIREIKLLDANTNTLIIIMLMISLFGFISAFSSIYFSLFSINKSWFIVGDFSNSYRLAFEFFYYTFNITTTIGGNGGNDIVVIGVVPKIFQMLDITIFYFYFANVIISIFQRSKTKSMKS
jgi:hypothetical protein